MVACPEIAYRAKWISAEQVAELANHWLRTAMESTCSASSPT